MKSKSPGKNAIFSDFTEVRGPENAHGGPGFFSFGDISGCMRRMTMICFRAERALFELTST